MRNGAYAGLLWRYSDLPNPVSVLFHGEVHPVPPIYIEDPSAKRLHSASRNVETHTEIADQVSLFGVGCPLPVDNFAVWTNIEAELLIAPGKRLIASFVLDDRVFPALEVVVAVADGGYEWFQPRIKLKYRLWIKLCGRHGRR